MVAVVLSIAFALGAMGHMGLPQTAVSSALPLLLVTIASSYAIHVLIYYYHEDASNPDRVETALAKVLPSLFLVGLTSSLGAATLIVFNILMIKEFAIASMIGIMGAWFINVTVTPALLQLTRGFKDRRDTAGTDENSWLERLLLKITRFSATRYKMVVFSYAFITVLACASITQLKTGLDFLHLFKEDNQARVAFNQFNDSLAGARFFNIMITAPEAGDIQSIAFLNAIRDFQTFMNEQSGVGYTHSVADVVEQIATAIGRTDDSDAFPATDEQLAQYILLYDMSGDPGDFENLVDYDYQRAKIQVVLKTSDPDHHYRLYEVAKGYLDTNLPAGATADFGGDIILWLAKVDYIVKGKIQNIILALGLIVMTCGLAYRSLNSGVLAVLPIAFGVVLTFGFMSLFGLRLDMPTSIITGIAVGIGIDFSIHYLNKLRALVKATKNIDKSLKMTACTSGKAVVFDTFTNMLGFSMLIMSAFQPVQIFGYLVSFTMLIMGASVIMLLPAIVVWLKPKFIFGHIPPEDSEVEGLLQQG
jgi:predicted RND superfamily exporter protein